MTYDDDYLVEIVEAIQSRLRGTYLWLRYHDRVYAWDLLTNPEQIEVHDVERDRIDTIPARYHTEDEDESPYVIMARAAVHYNRRHK